MTREEAISILNENLTNKNMIKHCMASGAVMRGLVKRVLKNPSEEEAAAWELAGLLHDADAEDSTQENHGVVVGEWFREGGKYEGKLPKEYEEQIIHAMAAHNEMTGVACQSPMDWSLYAGEKLTGLIVATALVLPSRKLSDVDTAMVMRRFKEKSFARGAKRENIQQGTRLGLGLEEFVGVCLKSMREISDELGL